MEFRIWAPHTDRVELVLGDQRVAMERLERGYWQVDVPAEDAASGYWYSLDGTEPIPDPRSVPALGAFVRSGS